MGYKTRYFLKVDSDRRDEIIGNLISSSKGAESALDYAGDSRGSVKWYEYQRDMKEFSKSYPNILFSLEGHGEDDGDIWKEYFINGKSQKVSALISFPEFDINKAE